MRQLILHSTSLKDFQTIIGDIVEEKLRQFKPDQPETPSKYLTRREVCDLLKVSLATLHYYTKDGILKSYRIGGRVLFDYAEVMQAVTQMGAIKHKRRA